MLTVVGSQVLLISLTMRKDYSSTLLFVGLLAYAFIRNLLDNLSGTDD